eukprot:g6339.t1
MDSAALLVESEGAPQTPTLMELRDGSSQQTESRMDHDAKSRHRKNRTGIPKFDPGDLSDWNINPEQKQDEQKQEQDKLEQEQDKEEQEQEEQDESCTPWPPTPSCGSQETSLKGNYEDSDQETFIADSSCEYSEDDNDDDDEEEEEDPLSYYDMHDTLLDNEYLSDFTVMDPMRLIQNEVLQDLPPYVGLDDVHSLSSIPEEQELYLDKTGNCILSESSMQRASLQSIEMDAVAWDCHELSTNPDQFQKCLNNNDDHDDDGGDVGSSIKVPPENREQDFSLVKRTVSERRPGGFHRRNRFFITEFNLIEENNNNNNEPELLPDSLPYEISVIQNLDKLVLPEQQMQNLLSPKKQQEQERKKPVSSGGCSCCCPGFVSSPLLNGARQRLQAIGKVLRKHWPVITSAVLPILLLFTYRNKSS